MQFIETELPGVYLVELAKRVDERGYFARSWCRREFEELGLNAEVAQVNVGFSLRRGTLRGLHYQRPPYAEVKIVRCTRGAVYDVAVDLRADSPTFRQWIAVELSAENGRALYVPESFAHGYQTLVDEAEISYQTTQSYEPSAAAGVRYDDPALAIEWPLAVECISDSDRSWPLLDSPTHADRMARAGEKS